LLLACKIRCGLFPPDSSFRYSPFAKREEDTSDNLLAGSFEPWRIGGFVDGRVRSHLVERFWGLSELTFREWIGSIDTTAFVDTNPTDERITSEFARHSR
jgi:hypothetical protein